MSTSVVGRPQRKVIPIRDSKTKQTGGVKRGKKRDIRGEGEPRKTEGKGIERQGINHTTQKDNECNKKERIQRETITYIGPTENKERNKIGSNRGLRTLKEKSDMKKNAERGSRRLGSGKADSWFKTDTRSQLKAVHVARRNLVREQGGSTVRRKRFD